MKHGRCIFISVITHINAVEKQRMEMRIEAQVTGSALNDGEPAAFAVGGATLFGGAFAIPSCNCFSEDAQHGAQQGAIISQRKTQRKRQRQHPLSQRHFIGQHVVSKIRCAFIHATAAAAWTEATALAAERNNVSRLASVAVKLREAMLWNAAG